MVKEKLQEIFRDIFDDDTLVIENSTTAADIEDWDSLAHIQLIAAIEKAFHVKFTLKEVVSAENVGAFIRLIENKL